MSDLPKVLRIAEIVMSIFTWFKRKEKRDDRWKRKRKDTEKTRKRVDPGPAQVEFEDYR